MYNALREPGYSLYVCFEARLLSEVELTRLLEVKPGAIPLCQHTLPEQTSLGQCLA